MALLLQLAIEPKVLHGHLSNERRLSDETRNWVAEYFEPSHSRAVVDPFQIKHIQKQQLSTPSDLACPYFDQILLRLREPARWATQQRLRIHFEWVWDGNLIWLVQADRATEVAKGRNPLAIPKVGVPTQLSPKTLSSLRVFDVNENSGFRKLKNVSEYAKAGLPTIELFVLDDQTVIHSLAEGQATQQLDDDLEVICRDPIVLRSDISDVPIEDTHLLPRTDAIRDAQSLRERLCEFSRSLLLRARGDRRVGFILHRYLPATSSCFCYATPNDRRVRIESVWGFADGLSYFSHDTFEVDCRAATLGPDQSSAIRRFAYAEKVRYKSRFLVDRGDGSWQFDYVAPPWDRRRSISRESWILQIAYYTKRFAQLVGSPINMMWFVGVSREHFRQQLIPWYHETAGILTPVSKAPDPRRVASQYPTVRNSGDIELLATRPEFNGRPVISVRLDPDQNALRDREFAERAADLSRSHRIRLELAGGILAHVYYQLVHSGAIVDCIDPFESTDDVESFGKLVRDRVPDKVVVGGESVEVRTLKGEELIAALKSKVLEEALEVFGAVGRGALTEELADLEEVIAALCSRLSIDAEEIREIRSKKNEQRGAFDEGYVLLRTRTPRLERKNDETRLFSDLATQGEGRSINGALFECSVATPESSKIEITISLIPPHNTKEIARKLTVRGQVMLMSARNDGKRIHLTVEMLPVPEQLRLLLNEEKELNAPSDQQHKSDKAIPRAQHDRVRTKREKRREDKKTGK